VVAQIPYFKVMQSRDRGWVVLTLFFCSGATALVYEVVWSKLLSQMFGSTIYAQTVVLAVFMGGLALGNWIVGRWSDRLRQPVRAYGCLEIAIGIYAFLFLTFDKAADRIFVAIGSHIVERSGLLLALKGVLSLALLLGPTILMGGTLPLLAAWLQKSYADPGRRSARFYSVNSLGAVVGAALAGFWLVQAFGMAATLRITALVNVLVGTAAILLSRSVSQDATQRVPATPEGRAGLPPGQDARSASLPDATQRVPATPGLIVALTGGVSMGLELLSSRSLALIFGSSLQSFAVVLIAFILGIGLGSAWIASPRRRAGSSERMIVLLLCVAVAWVVLLVFNIERWVDFYRIARTGLGHTPVGYVYHELLTVGIALVILGFPAALIGAVLPLMIRVTSQRGTALGAEVGALLTWNTLGAVAGTLLTGFVLMPQVGLRNAFGTLALVLALAALVVAGRQRWSLGIAGAAALCALTVSLFAFGGEGWRQVMSSGIFRIRETHFESRLMPIRKEHMKIVFYEDGPDATVSVEQVDGIIAPAMLGLRTNGKPEAGTQLDMSTQLLVSHLPMLARPGAKDVFVLGLASGMTAGALLAYPIDRLDVAENCEPVIQASKLFDDWNRHVLSDPRTHLWREDARTVLKLRPQLYDVIITEPSNPWFVGTGSVFSREYYRLAASRLKPGGLMAQWFQIYETQDQIVDLVLRTFSSVFNYVEIWDAGAGDIILLGAMEPWPTGPDVFRQSFNIPQVRTDMEMIDLHSPEALLARQLASQRTGFAIAGDGPIQSDLFPVLEYAAPRAFYLSEASQMLDRFDERTRQQLLAPLQKRAMLGSLLPANAQVIFSTYMTVNRELGGCLFGLPSSADVPCIFPTAQPRPPAGAGGTILDVAARMFEAGNLAGAGELAAQALAAKPGDDQARYLARVIDREKQSRQAARRPGDDQEFTVNLRH
jgi:predicted membrane-bound spermidine synthase